MKAPINRRDKNNVPRELLLRQETKSLEALSLAYLCFFICANGGFWVADLFGISSMPGAQLSLSIISIAVTFFVILLTLFFKKKILFVKFIIFILAVVLIFAGILFLHSIWMFFAYFPVLAMAGLFNDRKLPLIMAGMCIAAYITLFVMGYFGQSTFIIWFTYIVLTSIIIFFITRRNYNFLLDFSENTQWADESKAVLEIKVKARTKELQELAASLEKKVEERTKELKSKIDEMEKIQKFTVGRELKMMELKKQIKELQK